MVDLAHFNLDKYVAENKIRRVSMEEILEYPKRKSTVAIKYIDGGYVQRTEELIQTLLYLSHENLDMQRSGSNSGSSLDTQIRIRKQIRIRNSGSSLDSSKCVN
ncbi:hypothetical protein Tco_0149460 [Tanacetum coccineum]